MARTMAIRPGAALVALLVGGAWVGALGEPPGGTLHLRELRRLPPDPAGEQRSPGGAPDCNGNGIPDETDILEGTSADCDANAVPDECDVLTRFTTRAITNVADGAQAIVTADLDGDGDQDVAAALADDDRFTWHRNLDGHGTFSSAITIGSGANFAVSIFPIDLDGDADTDLLTASAFDATVGWYENTDGAATFGPRQVISSALTGAWSVVAADVDGDGDPDAIAAAQSSSLIVWYPNLDGLGSFGPPRIVSTQADIPVSIVAADVDGDGDLDVLSASDGDDRIAWYENTDGLGSFGAQQTITQSADDASAVRAADLDGDGDLDALSASFLDHEIAWYEKLDGSDGFGPQQIIATSAILALSVFAADLDADGDLDVLSASGGDNKIAWYENTDGAGVFGAEQVISTDAGGAAWVHAADVDGDGDLDVLSAAEGNNRLTWYENDGNDCDGNGVPDVCQSDCDDNGRADACDLTAGSGADCNANTVLDACDIAQASSADCTGNGVPDECEPDCNANLAADSCDIDAGTSGDCTSNGVPDECEPDCNANLAADSCDIDAGASGDCTGNGVPDECEPDCNANLVADSCDIDAAASADCDGNVIPDECDVDLGAADCDANGVLDGCQTRTTFAPHVISATADFTRAVFGADLDADGDVDVLSASLNDDKLAWYKNADGAGGFGPQQVISVAGDGAIAVHAADLDGDRAPDVLGASFNDSELAWHPSSDPAGTFGPRRLISTSGIGAISVVAGDLDGDGDRDVVAASFGDDGVAWYENIDGRGFFGPERSISTVADGAVAVAAADLDGDGDLDVLSASRDDDEIAWHENADGIGGVWIEHVLTGAAADASSVLAADLDGDGDLDVLSASQADDTVGWHASLDGHGTFAPRAVLSTSGNGAVSAFAADVDGDGAMDIATASFYDDRIAWQRNLGGASAFDAPRTISTAARGAYSVFAADLDGDGTTDVLSASQNDDEITWYENLSGDCNGNGAPDACDVGAGTSTDCNLDGVPDECQPDCNANGVPDPCDIGSGASTDCNLDGVPDECQPARDCNTNGIPDACDSGCTACDADGDGCLDGADLAPANPAVCGDTDGDGCDDCKSGAFDPAADGIDADHDGICNLGDCATQDDEAWAEPGAVTGLTLAREAGATLRWRAPDERGSIFLRYDVLRSTAPDDFGPAAATCRESDGQDRSAVDAELPVPGAVFHYLVRVDNDCPGSGNLGTDSAGAPRSGRPCP